MILLSLAFVYHFSNSRLANLTTKQQCLFVGISSGAIAVTGMLLSIETIPGVMMSGRVIVAIAGLFGGICSALPAIIMISLWQIWSGGVWMLPAMGINITGGILGVLAHQRFKDRFEQIRFHHLLGLGLMLGVNDWVWNLGKFNESIQSFSPQILVLYPLAALIMAHLILNDKKRSISDAALQKNEKKYRVLVDEMPDVRYRSDLAGNITFISKAVFHMFGYTQEEGIGMNSADIYVDPDERQTFIAQLQKTGEIFDYQTQLRHRDGSIWWGSTSARFLKDQQGKPIGVEGITRDITKRKRQEDLQAAQLRLVEFGANHSITELLQKIIDEAETLTNSCIGFFHFLEADQNTISRQAWSTDTQSLCRSDTAQSHYPVSDAGLWSDCIHSRKTLIQNTYENPSQGSGLPGGHVPLERFMVVPVIREDRVEAILGLGNKAFNYDTLDKDSINQLATFAWETVVRKQAEEALADQETKLRAVFNQTYQLMGLFSTNGTYLAVNRAAIEFCGFDESTLKEYVVWDSPWWHHSEKEQERARKAFCKASAGEFLRFEITNIDQRGRTRTLDTSIRPIFNENKEVIFVCVEGRDITDEKEAEEEKRTLEAQLLQSQKLEAIGTLAGGVAHDFNNILSGIIGFVELAQEDIREGDPVKYYIDQISQSSYRASDLVEQILLFSRQKDQEMKPVNAMVLIKEVIQLLRSTISKSIEIQTRFSAENPMVMSSPSQIHQILMNLCTNSMHAMEKKGGTLSVFLDTISLDQKSASLYSDLSPGPFLKLMVSDTGHGIPDKIINRIFDPFFSTKPRGEGTGLGLAVVHGIVKKSKGNIFVESSHAKGTDILVFLPLVEASKPGEGTGEIKPHRGDEHILFVDDELLLVEPGTEILQRQGYQVTAESDSSKAWALFSEDPDRFDIVITDNQMPGMNGLDLARKMIDLRPHIPIIMCTGFGDTLTVNQAREIGIKTIVYKPIIKHKLASAIRRILDEPIDKPLVKPLDETKTDKGIQNGQCIDR